jgi:hypothetical protein
MKTGCSNRTHKALGVMFQVEVFWVVSPCDDVRYQRFRGPRYLTLKMEVPTTQEAWWAPEPVWTRWLREKKIPSLPLPYRTVLNFVLFLLIFTVLEIRRCIQKFPDWVDNEITTINTRWETIQRVLAEKLARLTHDMAIQLHLVAESCTICSSRLRRPVRKLLVTPSYTACRPQNSSYPGSPMCRTCLPVTSPLRH